MFKKIKSLFKRSDISVGCYLLLAIPDEDVFWQIYEDHNALHPDDRLRLINPIKPYDRSTGENCWIHRIKKPITRAFYQVTGIKDGIMVRSIQKGHPRALNDDIYDTTMWRFPVNLNNILDVASDRDEMITKREMIK